MVFDMSKRRCKKGRILRTLANGETVYPDAWIPLKDGEQYDGEIWLCRPNVVWIKDNKGVHQELQYSPIEKVEPDKPEELRTNGERRDNNVYLDPVRLRYAFPNGVPDVRLPEIFGDPEKHAEIWETLEYIFTGKKEYRDEHERNMDALIKRFMTQ